MITHFKIRGKKNWGRSAALIRRIDEARAAGIDVTMAQYPLHGGEHVPACGHPAVVPQQGRGRPAAGPARGTRRHQA